MTRPAALLMLVALAFAVSGCAVFDPAPTTEGSRVSKKLAALPKPPREDRKIVTVYDFRVNVPYASEGIVARGATDQFITALVKSGHFIVVERAHLQELAAEKNLQRSGVATGTAGRTKLTGAGYIFQGAVTELEETSAADARAAWWTLGLGAKQRTATVGIDVRIVDAGTGMVLDAIDVRKKVRAAGVVGSYDEGRWVTKRGARGGAAMSKALSLAVRECIEEAVYQLAKNFGVPEEAAAAR
jgi:curli biogenesis system outer membrane secretion channel CsgG